MLEKSVLIAYASLTGCARGIAEELERLLEARGIPSEARYLRTIHDLSPYRAVIVGSAIREEGWLPEAVEFVAKHQQQLKTIPAFYYLVSITMHQDTPDHTQTALLYLRPVRQLVEPVDVGLFAGNEDFTLTARQTLAARASPRATGATPPPCGPGDSG
ncbi:MAG: flavodoxin domain-containing protein [Candidatus Methanomethylicaceae archaeon]